METLRIKGFRSIENSGDIQLKPITVAIGKNSCGKSSFIRFFPLLKQSMEKDISESLLWYGDYVDFGDYNNIKPIFNKKTRTSFGMKLNINKYNSFYFGNVFSKSTKNMPIEVNIDIAEKYIEHIQLKYFDQNIELKLNQNNTIKKITINGYSNHIDIKKFKWYRESKCLIPIISNIENGEDHIYYRFYADEYINKTIKDIFIEIGIETEKIDSLIEEVSCISSKKSLQNYFLHECDIEKVCDYFKNNSEMIDKINSYIVMGALSPIIYNIDRKMLEEAENLHYLKPIRANVNRYYRIQGVSIDQVDSDGSNLAMILYNLADEERNKFENWCKENFNIMFSISKESGHASLIIKDEQGNKTNLADTGYGYSQILPIIVELWLLLNKKNRLKNKSITIVIEQPELHLHPAFQAKIVDLFSNIIKIAKSDNIDLKIIFETHSAVMVNELGSLISAGLLQKDDVNILAFEKSDNISKISSLYFNEAGLITDWPVGFLSAN